MEDNITYYECAICHTKYKTEEEMNTCMASHERAAEITKTQYHSYKLSDSEYPDDILIKFTDGKVKRYQLA